MIMWSALAVALLMSFPAFAGPDLTGSVQVTIEAPCEDGEVAVTFIITVTNEGDEACADEWFVDFWANWPCQCTDHPDDVCAPSTSHWSSMEFGGLAPGESVTLQPPTLFVQPTNATYTYMLYVDSSFGGTCDEDNEDNNLVCGYYDLPPCAPDLLIQSFTASADVVETETGFVCAVDYMLTVENAGLGPIGQFDVDLFFNAPNEPTPEDGGEGMYGVGPPLEPGETYDFYLDTQEFGPLLPGGPTLIQHSWVLLDIMDIVWELHEGNNVADLHVKCKPPAPEEPAIEEFPDVLSIDVVELIAVEVVAVADEEGEPAPEDAAAEVPNTADDSGVGGDNLPSSGETGSDCGCRMHAPARTGAGVWLLLVLAGLLGLLCRA